jgi:putative ABC transport system permease protein
VAYIVERRTGEKGVRMALGANRARAVGLVVGSVFVQEGVGRTLGIPAAMSAGKLITDQLFSITPSDGGTPDRVIEDRL